jgi:benzaldehyde dehydrogenase (NAD)
VSTALSHQEHEGQLYSNGWREAEGGTVDVKEPATGATLGTVGLAGASDVAAACERAAAAQNNWGLTPGEERAQVLRRAADLLEQRGDDVVEWIMRETGAIRGKAENELGGSVGELREAAALCTQPFGELLSTGERGRLSMAQRVPLGVVGVITPWNFPLVLAMRCVAPGIALGNTVVLKPDVQTPVSGGMIIASVLEEAGLPEGVLHVLPGAAEAGEALVTDRHARMISFTGSTAVGKRVGELAGKHLKKVSLELGGNNVLLILEDADLEAAISAGAWGSFLHQGQICLTTGRHLVQERVAQEYVDRLAQHADALSVGDPWREPDVALGPIINDRQLDRVEEIVQATIAAGAAVRAGATHEGRFYRPTVLAGVTPDMRAFSDEIFGPVAPVTTFSSEEEALALCNSSDYGLTAAVYTRRLGRGLELARAMKTGMVHVNDTTVNDAPNAPFGGTGASGNGGRYGSLSNWEEFTQWQWVTVKDEPTVYPF